MDTDENPMRNVFGVHHCDRAAMVSTPGRLRGGFDRYDGEHPTSRALWVESFALDIYKII
jgi:hypothetical protein